MQETKKLPEDRLLQQEEQLLSKPVIKFINLKNRHIGRFFAWFFICRYVKIIVAGIRTNPAILNFNLENK